MEGVRITQRLLAPLPTFLLWRRMRLWALRSYDQVIKLVPEHLVYQARFRSRFGPRWRRKAPVESLMPLRLARYGAPLAQTAPARRSRSRSRSREPLPLRRDQRGHQLPRQLPVRADGGSREGGVQPPLRDRPGLGDLPGQHRDPDNSTRFRRSQGRNAFLYTPSC